MSARQHFAQTYAEARTKFLAAAAAAGAAVDSHPHPLPGQHGEALAMDVARLGPADAGSVLLVSSACHGVEGFCGSGVQHALLADTGFLASAAAAGVALLFVHALNPHGFSWWRRTTHENVDLNRNFPDFTQPLPHNTAYDAVAQLVIPPTWPPSAEVLQATAAYAAQHGLRGLQTAITAGQHAHPAGLFYGGTSPTWSHLTLKQVLRQHASQCSRLGWIDLHTGLGPSGHGERIFAGPDDAATLARVRAWWGAGVTSIYDGSSASALLSGLMWNAAGQVCPQAELSSIALEYGTVPWTETIDALREDQWCELHPEAGPERRAAARRRMRDAFYTDTDDWKQQILDHGTDAARQAVAGLAQR